MTGWTSPVEKLGEHLQAMRDGVNDVCLSTTLMRPDHLWEETTKGLRNAQTALDDLEQLYRSYWLGDDKEEVAGVDRRELLGLWRVLLGAAAVPLPAVYRLESARHDRSPMDESVMEALAAVTRSYAHSYPHVEAAEILPLARQHLDVLVRWLPEPMAPRLRARLGSITAETAALAGWAALTLNLRGDAWSYFSLGRDAARDVGDETLHAQVLGSIASLQSGINGGVATGSRVAIRTLEEAAARAQHAPALTRAWLAARLSEERAAVDDARGFHGDLQVAEDAFGRAGTEGTTPGFFGADGFLAVWGDACLAGYQGIGQVLLGQGEQAVPVLVSTLDQTVDERQCVVVLADLASAWTLADEPEEACQVAIRTIDLAERASFPLGVERVRGVRHRLQGREALPAVRELDERLAAMHKESVDTVAPLSAVSSRRGSG